MLDLTLGHGTHLSLQTRLVHDLVNVVGGDSRLNLPSRNIQHFASEATHLAHALLFLLVQNLDSVATNKNLLRARNTILCIIWMPYGCRDLALLGKGIDWSQGTGVGKGREWVELAGCWIRFRNDFGGDQIAKEVTLRLVHRLVFGLKDGVRTEGYA